VESEGEDETKVRLPLNGRDQVPAHRSGSFTTSRSMPGATRPSLAKLDESNRLGSSIAVGRPSGGRPRGKPAASLVACVGAAPTTLGAGRWQCRGHPAKLPRLNLPDSFSR